MRKRPLRTREQARADIERRGISLADEIDGLVRPGSEEA